MLILTRKPGERILIGDRIVVTVVRIGPNNVRLGVDAPRDVDVVRDDAGQGPNARQLRLERGETDTPAA